MFTKSNEIDVRNSPAIRRIIEEMKQDATANISPTMYNRIYSRHNRS